MEGGGGGFPKMAARVGQPPPLETGDAFADYRGGGVAGGPSTSGGTDGQGWKGIHRVSPARGLLCCSTSTRCPHNVVDCLWHSPCRTFWYSPYPFISGLTI